MVAITMKMRAFLNHFLDFMVVLTLKSKKWFKKKNEIRNIG
jgi:hypothetical protein